MFQIYIHRYLIRNNSPIKRSATDKEHMRALDAVRNEGVLAITNRIDAFSTEVNKARDTPATPITSDTQLKSSPNTDPLVGGGTTVVCRVRLDIVRLARSDQSSSVFQGHFRV